MTSGDGTCRGLLPAGGGLGGGVQEALALVPMVSRLPPENECSTPMAWETT